MQVIKTYSGKVGCMCGCKGKWNYTAYGAENHQPGYSVDARDRAAKIITTKVMNNPNRMLDEENKCYYVEDRVNNKMQAVYFD
jgi:hypothetical protein